VGAASFTWNDQEWIGVTREVAEPPVRLAAAAMAQPFAEPFESTARRSLFVLLSVAAFGFLTVVALTGRLTASLESLATAARGVAGGDLTRTLPVETSDEVGAVTEAFNTMIRSLRRTLRQLAERESLAAVNEFAASLAHEVRNPLTSVQLDLQQVEESLPAESDLRVLQGEALEELRRLDRTVARALEVARSGRVEPRPIDLVTPLRAAVRRARPEVERRAGQLEVHLPAEGLPMLGDPDALEQLFLNLLLNAAAAIGSGQRVSVMADAGDEAVEVRIRDEGAGIPAADLDRIFEPFFTTREGGTGLGLAVARRIAVAHRGAIRIRSDERAGTTVEIELPFDGSHHFGG
jgi:signal transduction histidine kinase